MKASVSQLESLGFQEADKKRAIVDSEMEHM